MTSLKGVFMVIAVFIVNVTSREPLNRNVTCGDGRGEFPFSALCDGVNDCLDFSDENYLGKGLKCQIHGSRFVKCIDCGDLWLGEMCLTSWLPEDDYGLRCVLPQELVKDAETTFCLDALDRCFDEKQQLIGSNCFRCLDSRHVISVTQVCDGIIDCDDMSDECLCQNNAPVADSATMNALNPVCSHLCMATETGVGEIGQSSCSSCSVGEVTCSFKNGTFLCVKPHQVCDGVVDCPDGVDEKFCIQEILCDNNETVATSCDNSITCGDFSDECATQCWQEIGACDHVTGETFACSIDGIERLPSNRVCDHVIDCHDNMTDEKGCSTSDHFYCWRGDLLFVNRTQRFDGVRDCEFGSDECPSLFQKGLSTTYANHDQLVRNPFLLVMVWILLVPALFGNVVVIVVTSQELWKDRHADNLGRLAKCNRTFVLNLAFADLLMGIYLLMLGVLHAVYHDNYCINDRSYRTSRTCTAMGILSQVSAQTSVFLLLLMTSYRLYGTLHPFRVEESRLIGGAASLATVSWTTSIVLAFTPQAGFLNDYFVVSYWLPLPFFNYDFVNKEQMKNLVLGLYSINVNSSSNLPDLGWKSMIDYVKSLHLPMIHPAWGEQYVVPIGYYNQYAMCQPFFYPEVGDTGWIYMSSIIIFNFLAFIYIAVAYVVIYKASSKPMVRKSVRRRSRQWRRDNRTMQKKIMCLVMTDLACWLPVCIIFLLKISGCRVHPIVHGITGTVLLPINSAVNPIIYSNAITKLRNLFRRKRGYLDSNSSDASDAAKMAVIRQASKASLDTIGSIKSSSSIGNLFAADSPSSRRGKNSSAAMRKKKSNGFVRARVTFATSSKDDHVESESVLELEVKTQCKENVSCAVEPTLLRSSPLMKETII